MKTWQKVLIGCSIGYLVLKWQKPHWYEDLMNRAYAPDYLVPQSAAASPQAYQLAAAAAAAVGLPVGWLIDIASKVKPGDLTIIAGKIRDKVMAMGPPADTQQQTLDAYKSQAIGAAGVPIG